MSRSEALTKALPLLYALEERGFEAVFVGGCVRDTLLGRPLKDVDIATAASPEQVTAAFPHTVPTGLQHGTVTVVHEGETYEITTFRTESEYERFRRPAQVRFVTSLHEDLLRRDFTINGMALRADGTLVDPFGGRLDLERGVLRCVGDADARLQEDALRIVRAIRFAAAYDLRIAHGTWRAIRRHKELLAHIAMERIGMEFDKMIGGSRPNKAAALLAASGMLPYTKEALPEGIVSAASSCAARPVRERLGQTFLARGLTALEEIQDGEDRWAAVCIALSLQAGQASELFGLLRYSTARSARLAAVLAMHAAMADRIKHDVFETDMDALQTNELPIETANLWILTVLRVGQAAADSWISIITRIPSLISPSLASRGERMSAFVHRIHQLSQTLQGMPVYAIRDLKVKGKDVLSLTDKPSGPWLGQLLQGLLRAAALGEVPNEKEPLLAEATKRINRNEDKANEIEVIDHEQSNS